MKGLILFFLIFSNAAFSKTVFYSDQVETIRVPLGMQSLLKFDSQVKTVVSASLFEIKPTNEDAPDFALLTVEPRTAGAQSLVTFILTNGKTLKLKFVATKKEPASETFYEFKSRFGDDSDALSNQVVEVPGKLDLMKALIRGDTLNGYEISTPNKVISGGSAEISTKLLKVYSGKEYLGFIYELTNNSYSKGYKIDIRRLRVGKPNAALLSYASKDDLPPREGENVSKSLVIVVTKPTGYGQAVILPVGIPSKAKEQ